MECGPYISHSSSNGPRQAKKCLQTCEKCADSDPPAHAQSIIRAFAFHSYILWYPMILLADSEGPDQTAQADLCLLCPHIPEHTFSHGAAQVSALHLSSPVRHSSRKHAYINLTPLTPLLYRKTGVYRGIHYFFLFLCSKHRLWVPVRTTSPRRF